MNGCMDKPILRFETKTMRAADLGGESCLPDLLGESILQNSLTFHLAEDDEVYEGYGRRNNAYPYRQHNLYTRELAETEVKTAVLENKYLKAVFLTEYGGRLWELWDKETGRNLLYTNDVLQFSNLAVRNAWFSGGVEWNIGIIGHTPYTTDQLYVAKTENEAGSPVLRMYEYERIRKVVYQMEFWLDEESRFLNCRMRIVNEGSEVVPMYWWSNIAVPEHENGRIIVPADKAFTHIDGHVYKVDVPLVNDIDITDYKKIVKSVDYFFDIPDGSPKYVANVDDTGYGLIQLSTGRLRSRKLFSWGNTDASDHWQEFLTDKAGRYVEIQAGLGKTQYGCVPMAPHTAWEWMEQYGALQLPAEELAKEHKERAAYVTQNIREQSIALEQTLKATKEAAKKQAELVIPGSGYGALTARNASTEHLEFLAETEAMQNWKNFFDTAVMHCPDPMTPPDEFLMDESNVEFLASHMEGANDRNWYAHYQLGIGYYVSGKYEAAEKELRKSNALVKNPWALHALSCTYMVLNRKKEAADCILAGMEMQKKEISYLKEGCKLLFLCEEYDKLCRFYETLEKEEQNINKIKFYYISALHALSKDREAYDLLEENGGMELEDIREGEDSFGRLWTELYEALYGEGGQIPHRYNFKAY